MENDQIDDITAKDLAEAAEKPVPVREHPLFLQMERQMAEGDDEGAAQSLRNLSKLYPGDQTVRDLEMRAALKSTFTVADSLPVLHSRPGVTLRLALSLLAIVAVCLTASAGLVFGYEWYVVPTAVAYETQTAIDQRWGDLNQYLQRDACREARTVLDGLEADFPGDRRIEEARGEVERCQARFSLYESAVLKQGEGDWAGALERFREMEATYPGYYRDVPYRISQLEERIVLEEKWQEARRLVDAGDLQSALPLLEEIRSRCPDCWSAEVHTHLFNAYSSIGMQLLDGAGSDIGKVEQAIDYLRKALRLESTRTDLADELKWAIKYVAGADAYNKQEWERAIQEWEPVYVARPDYADGVVRSGLFDAYSRAASDLLEGAAGEAAPLERAVQYIDHVPSPDPRLVEERNLAVEYLAGVKAYNAREWDKAIVHWGPIYIVRPSYQSGVLEEQLQVACAATDVEYDTWCSP